MGYFKLTFQGELELKDHDTVNLKILFYRATPSLYGEPTTEAYVHSNTKYVSFVRDLFENDNVGIQVSTGQD